MGKGKKVACVFAAALGLAGPSVTLAQEDLKEQIRQLKKQTEELERLIKQRDALQKK